MMPRSSQPYSIHCGASWVVFMRMAPTTAKLAIRLSSAKGQQLYPSSQERWTLEKGAPKK